MNAREWVSTHYIKHGRSWVEDHYEDHVKECLKPVPKESYSRYIRLTAWILKGFDGPDAPKVDHEESRPEVMAAADVSTVEDLEDYTRLNSARFEIQSGVVNTWGNKDNPNKQVKLTFKPRSKPAVDEILEDFRKHAADFSPDYTLIDRPEVDTGNLLEISVNDLHFGQLSWGKETNGPDYDAKISESCYLSAVSHLADASSSFKPERILFPVGSDFFNVDNKANTTSHGTPQDEDSRWMKTFSLGWKMVVRAVDILTGLADVDIVIIRGNHDEERAYYLGEVLSAWYANNQNVRVDNSPTIRKYYQHGKCLIGLTHGHAEKPELLPLIMATEVPDLWAATEYREIHVGHLHHSRVKSFQQETEQSGVRVMVLPSLAPPSAWAAGKGFRAIREAPAFIWNREYGKISSTYYHPGMMNV